MHKSHTRTHTLQAGYGRQKTYFDMFLDAPLLAKHRASKIDSNHQCHTQPAILVSTSTSPLRHITTITALNALRRKCTVTSLRAIHQCHQRSSASTASKATFWYGLRVKQPSHSIEPIVGSRNKNQRPCSKPLRGSRVHAGPGTPG